jgi:hypothetical protein
MAAYTDAMKWYRLGEPAWTSVRPKYLFHVNFYISSDTELQDLAREMSTCIRTVELPKYSIESEIVNAWNLRQVIHTKVNFEPVSISFNDTLDNIVQKFVNLYMNKISGNFAETQPGVRTGFDSFGIKMQDTVTDVIFDKIEIIRFYGASENRDDFQKKSIATLWRPKIVDIQHDTLDYSASEATTWTLSLRYESITYSEDE